MLGGYFPFALQIKACKVKMVDLEVAGDREKETKNRAELAEAKLQVGFQSPPNVSDNS